MPAGDAVTFMGNTASTPGQEFDFEILRKLKDLLLMPLSDLEKRIETIVDLGQRVDIYAHYLEPHQVLFVEMPLMFPKSEGCKVLLVYHSMCEEMAAMMRKLDIEVRVQKMGDV